MLPWNDWSLDFDQRLPIYSQITDRFCRALVKGEIAPSNRVPSIRESAIALKVNANTVQRAYQELERMQLIFSRRGTGYFVTEDTNMVQQVRIDMAEESMKGFLSQMRALGFSDGQIIERLSQVMKGGTEDVIDD